MLQEFAPPTASRADTHDRPRFARLPLLLLLACAAFVAAAAGGARAQDRRSVEPLEREMAGGGLQSYRLNLRPGQFIRAVFDQRGIDLVLVLTGPDGERLLEINNPVGEWGPEPLFFEIEKEGPYTVEVRPRLTSAGPGRYVLSLMVARDPYATDRKRFPAERAFSEGTRTLMAGQAGATEGALEKYDESLRLFRTISDRRGEITALTTIASVHHALGREQDAIRYFREALPVLRSVNDRVGEGLVLGKVAEAYHYIGDRDESLRNFEAALALFRAAGDRRSAAYTLDQIGHLYDQAGDKKRARAYYEEALPLFRAVADGRGEAITLNNLGLLYDAQGERDRAHAFFKDSLSVFDRVDDCYAIGQVLANFALDALGAGDKQKALEYLNEALGKQRGVGDRRGEAVTLNNIGFVYSTTGDLPRALEHFNSSLAVHRSIENREGEGDTLANLMFALNASARPRVAAFYGKQAVNAYQEVRRTIPPLDRDAQKSFIRSKETAYRQLATLLFAQGRLAEGQQVLDMLKEEEFARFVRRDTREAGSALAAPLSAKEAQAAQGLQQLDEQIKLRENERSQLVQKAARTPEEEAQLQKTSADLLELNTKRFFQFLDQLETEFGDTRKAGSVAFVRDTQNLQDTLGELGEGAVALYTLVGEDKYYVILTTPDRQVGREYAIKAADLNKKLADFKQQLQDDRSDPRPLAQELYRILVGPVAKDLEEAGAKTLMWSLDGALRYIPVSALHDGKGYLVERYRNEVFTQGTLVNLKDQPKLKWEGLGFGVSKAHGMFSPLYAVPEELYGIFRELGMMPAAEAAGGDGGVLPGKVRLDEAFTVDAFKESLAQPAPLVHIASHFAFRPGNETNSFLLMGDGSQLPLSEIRNTIRFRSVDLLTLSACNTATGGADADGTEVAGFAEIAQRKGAKAVIASLWPVSDESTRLLMQTFYRLRDEEAGITKVEAMRRAQLALLRGEVRAGQGGQRGGARARRGLTGEGIAKSQTPDTYSHPFFWAPFILIGNWK